MVVVTVEVLLVPPSVVEVSPAVLPAVVCAVVVITVVVSAPDVVVTTEAVAVVVSASVVVTTVVVVSAPVVVVTTVVDVVSAPAVVVVSALVSVADAVTVVDSVTTVVGTSVVVGDPVEYVVNSVAQLYLFVNSDRNDLTLHVSYSKSVNHVRGPVIHRFAGCGCLCGRRISHRAFRADFGLLHKQGVQALVQLTITAIHLVVNLHKHYNTIW